MGAQERAQKRGRIMAVKIEMDMPKNCLDCKLPSNMECHLVEGAILRGFANESRHEQCPLQEVKECK